MTRVRDEGTESDGVLAGQVLDRHRTYLRAIDSLFAAVDSGNATEVLRIDNDLVDPQFEAIESDVEGASSTHHEAATQQLSTLRKLETTTARLTPFIFVGGLLLAIGLAAISRGHGRLLVRERGQALHDSLHDSLTGLPNRTLLGDRLGQCLRSGRRSGQTTGLLLIDLDRFK
ncbi:MAG: GGDEF domain-containing protein, partial [Pedococcus sp.]